MADLSNTNLWLTLPSELWTCMYMFLPTMDIHTFTQISKVLHPQARDYIWTQRKWWSLYWDRRRLKQLGYVRRVTASDNDIETLFHTMTNWSYVTHLKMKAGTTDTGYLSFAQLTQIRHLDLSSYDIDDRGLSLACQTMTQLQYLDVSNCKQITDTGLLGLSSVTQLRHLDITNCKQITDAGLVSLSRLIHLRHLSLRKCQKITDMTLSVMVRTATRLQHLDLEECNITDTGLSSFSQLIQLKHLKLLDCRQVTDTGLSYLSTLNKLKHLALSSCRITCMGLAYLSTVTQLRYLNLSNNSYVTDHDHTGLSHLSPLTELQELGLSGCGITDAGLLWLPKTLTALTRLELSWNQITHQSVSSFMFTTFGQLQYLDLSFCDLNTTDRQSLLAQAPKNLVINT